ncbi:MAG: hypothetical protein BHW02_03850 [Clostridium sp. 28_12]|nr:MAG: hypothetical protein BHW02_03850 [Clostridium sp. 28_12]
MSTKTMKILTFIATILLVISLGTSTIFALTPSQVQPTDPGTNDIQTFGGKILGILQTVGIVLSVIILVILGIKYMMGSAEEKAEYKKTMIPYLVGAVLIFLAPTIANTVYTLIKGN